MDTTRLLEARVPGSSSSLFFACCHPPVPQPAGLGAASSCLSVCDLPLTCDLLPRLLASSLLVSGSPWLPAASTSYTPLAVHAPPPSRLCPLPLHPPCTCSFGLPGTRGLALPVGGVPGASGRPPGGPLGRGLHGGRVAGDPGPPPARGPHRPLPPTWGAHAGAGDAEVVGAAPAGALRGRPHGRAAGGSRRQRPLVSPSHGRRVPTLGIHSPGYISPPRPCLLPLSRALCLPAHYSRQPFSPLPSSLPSPCPPQGGLLWTVGRLLTSALTSPCEADLTQWRAGLCPRLLPWLTCRSVVVLCPLPAALRGPSESLSLGSRSLGVSGFPDCVPCSQSPPLLSALVLRFAPRHPLVLVLLSLPCPTRLSLLPL